MGYLHDIETFVQAFPPVNIDVFGAAFTPVFVLVVCLGVLACCLCRSVTVIPSNNLKSQIWKIFIARGTKFFCP